MGQMAMNMMQQNPGMLEQAMQNPQLQQMMQQRGGGGGAIVCRLFFYSGCVFCRDVLCRMIYVIST
jgi:hypothetical protein